MKVALVYYSQTGNTEAMANIFADALNGKAEVSIIDPSAFTSADIPAYDAFAFGCPAMGDEVLEEAVFEPMFEAVEMELAGRRVFLFGSYGWGDGQWMRDWQDRCLADGALLAAEPVIANEAPDEEAAVQLKEAALRLIS